MQAHEIENIKKAVIEAEKSSQKLEMAQRDFMEKLKKLKDVSSSSSPNTDYPKLKADALAVLGGQVIERQISFED